MVGRWSPSPFWGGNLRPTSGWMAQPPKTRTPVANLRVEWQRVPCLGLGGLGKTRGRGWVAIFVLQKNGGRQGQTLLVLGSVSDVSVSLKQIYEAYHLLMNFERWYVWYLCTLVWRCWMIGWLFCQQIVPSAKTKRTSCDLWKDANFKKKATFHL